jgi:quercetin dioxygenase-like cupin family protein
MRRLMLCVVFSARLFAQTATEVEITAEPHHHLVFANEQVRVFNVDVPPHIDTLMHWHRHDYFYVMLGPVEVVNAVKGKDPVKAKLQLGQVGFTPGPFAHIARDVSDLPFRNVTIEILQDDKMRHAAAKWDDERSLVILQGGTQEILFVKDGIRASEFELQPGGVVPVHSHAGPHLLVTVTDLDLYLNDPRRHDSREPAVPVTHLHAGESRWFAAGVQPPITNAGHGVAKFAMLEFP